MKYDIIVLLFLFLYAGSCFKHAASQQCDCSCSNELEARLDKKLDAKMAMIQQTVIDAANLTRTLLYHLHRPGATPNHPAKSCAEILHYIPNSPSGYYWIESSPSYSGRQYCDMTRSCGGVTGGWMRVASLNMRNISQQCPSGLRERVYSGKRTCGVNSDSGACSSATLPSIVEYTKVCGRIRGYQSGTPDAFNREYVYDYVDGVTLTYGNPRQHIWTFAAGLDEISHTGSSCPCLSTRGQLPPAFVGNDYFCDTGSSGRYEHGVFYGDDPLWDGAGCGSGNRCCSFNTPPWFYKQLPQPTTDNIEMRVCRSRDINNEDVVIDLAEIYIQ